MSVVTPDESWRRSVGDELERFDIRRDVDHFSKTLAAYGPALSGVELARVMDVLHRAMQLSVLVDEVAGMLRP